MSLIFTPMIYIHLTQRYPRRFVLEPGHFCVGGFDKFEVKQRDPREDQIVLNKNYYFSTTDRIPFF